NAGNVDVAAAVTGIDRARAREGDRVGAAAEADHAVAGEIDRVVAVARRDRPVQAGEGHPVIAVAERDGAVRTDAEAGIQIDGIVAVEGSDRAVAGKRDAVGAIAE